MGIFQMKCPLKMNNNPTRGFRVFFWSTLRKVIRSVDRTIFTFQENLRPYFQFFAKFWKKTSNSGSNICFLKIDRTFNLVFTFTSSYFKGLGSGFVKNKFLGKFGSKPDLVLHTYAQPKIDFPFLLALYHQ